MTTKGTILVVEDEPVLRKLLRYFLAREGYEVRTAGESLQVFEALQEQRPHVVLLDIRLPGINGLEFLRHIRRTAPEIIIFIISGVLDEATRMQALAMGAIECLEKPLDFRHLQQRLAAASAIAAG